MLRRALAVAVVSLALAPPVLAQGNPREEVKLKLGGKAVSIEYGRPSLKGRDMLGRAEVGQDWRMGADTETTLSTEADLAFGTVMVPKGKHTLRARKVAADEWHLVVSQGEKTVAEIPLETSKSPQSVEMFTIKLADDEKGQGVFRMSWGNVTLGTRFKAK